MSKPFIGIKAIYYGEPIAEAVTKEKLTTWLSTATAVENVHQDTWSYEQSDPEIEDYVNELDGKIYYRDPKTAGSKTISFTLGKYDAKTKAELCGGTATEDDMWYSSDEIPLVNKAIVAVTKSGNTIVFTNASIVAKAAAASKNIGLGVTAVAMDNNTPGVADEYILWEEVKKA
jgi:hypothetical protein